MSTVPHSERQRLVSTPVTLNGQKARVTGSRLDFPRVVITATGEGYEWSWEAVQRVINHKNGAFFS